MIIVIVIVIVIVVVVIISHPERHGRVPRSRGPATSRSFFTPCERVWGRVGDWV